MNTESHSLYSSHSSSSWLVYLVSALFSRSFRSFIFSFNSFHSPIVSNNFYLILFHVREQSLSFIFKVATMMMIITIFSLRKHTNINKVLFTPVCLRFIRLLLALDVFVCCRHKAQLSNGIQFVSELFYAAQPQMNNSPCVVI